jgi:uncharacterized protein
VFHELSAHARYSGLWYNIGYWRLSSGIEVDFILGDAQTAVEVKAKTRIHPRETRHLLEFKKEYPDVENLLIVSLESHERITSEGVRILPYRRFLDALWNGDLMR